ncbi:hypothetical protein SCYAM73S_08647 [Streptomyces cyaneofuscatus]
MDRGLGDAVHVDQRRRVLLVARVPVREPPELQRLAAEHHIPQRQVVPRGLPVGGGQLVERGRRLVENRHLLIGQQPEERLRVTARQMRYDDDPAAVEQRTPQLPHREVEGVGVEQRPHVVRTEREPVLGRRHQPRHIVLRDHNSLGAPGGSRGVDDVRRVLRAQRPRPVRLAQRPVGEARRLVHRDQRQLVRGQPVRRRRVRDQRGRTGVLQHVRQPVCRVVRVHRQICGARQRHREQPGHQVQRARQREGHNRAGADGAGREQPRQRLGTGGELRVRERLARAAHGHPVRVTARRHLVDLGERQRHRPVGGHAVGLDQSAVHLVRTEHGQQPDRRFRLRGRGGQQPGQPVCESLGGRPVEEVRAELQEPGDPAVGQLARVEGQVELGGARRYGGEPRGGVRSEGGGPVRDRLPGQHHLEQRVPGQRARRVQRLHQVVEGQRVVLVRGERRRPHPVQQGAEAGIAGGVGAQDHGVGEEADEPGRGVVVAARHGGAERDVGAAAVPGEEGGEARLHGHEDRRAVRPGQPAQRLVRGRVEGEGHGVTGRGGDGRAGPVGGQLQLVRQPGQRLAPVGELGLGERGRVGWGAQELL